MTEQPPEPIEDIAVAPKTINVTRSHGGRLLLAGVGQAPADVMFIATTVSEEEVRVEAASKYGGAVITEKPRFLKGPAGVIFKDLVLSTGLDMAECFYTALVRWLIPTKTERNRPKAPTLAWGVEMLEYEIERVAPKLIVTLGKPPFDLLYGRKLAARDTEGGFFRCEKYNCLLYPLPDIYQLVNKPEKLETWRVDLLEIAREVRALRGGPVERVKLDYRVITTAAQLEALMCEIWDIHLLSPDCEWHGGNHVDGQLRSLQLTWGPGKAAYIRFMDDKLNYAFDVPYREAGAILSRHLDRPEVKYFGHHISADLPWMHCVLGLNWYRKVLLDTEFATQVADEYADRSLERLAMRHTDLGRYDIDLMLWKKDAKGAADGGYGLIPDDLLMVYGMKDTDTVYRSALRIMADLQRQDLLEYYTRLVNPFVCDVFTHFVIEGLPMDKDRMDLLRDLMTFAHGEMQTMFRHDIVREAADLLEKNLVQELGEIGHIVMPRLKALLDEGATSEIFEIVKAVASDRLARVDEATQHFIESPQFNQGSGPMMARWLFGVKGFTPVKTTGKPSMSWEKVMDLPESRRGEFKPACDKQTLQVLTSEYDDEMLRRLLELRAVGTLCKNLLKEPTLDEDTGEVLRENGLHYWRASDGRVHGQFSATETGRSRSWKPNILNWSSYVHAFIKDGVLRCFKLLKEEGRLPERWLPYALSKADGGVVIPSIRSCTIPPPGWIMVESDYATAEVRGLAYFGNDIRLITALNEPDPAWGVWAKDGKTPVRLTYSEEEKVKPEHASADFVLSIKPEKGERYHISELELVRKEDGSFKHPKRDLHWLLAEQVHGRPREVLDEKKDRTAAKATRFKSAYGASGATLDRSLYSDTGVKPEPGTGQIFLDALRASQPDAAEWGDRMQEIPRSPGFWRAPSGRLRRFVGHPEWVTGINRRTSDGMYGAMGREMRNFVLQNSVGDTSARAGADLLDFGIRNNLQGRLGLILYDSCGTWCPLEERFIWDKAHSLYMYWANGWWVNGRVLRYPIDSQYNRAWTEVDKKLQAQMEDRTYCPTPAHLQPLEDWLDQMILYYQQNPLASVYNRADIGK